MGFIIVGVVLFAGAAFFGDKGYTWLVALTGALAVVYGAGTIVLRGRLLLRGSPTGSRGRLTRRRRAQGHGVRPMGAASERRNPPHQCAEDDRTPA